LFQAIYLNGGKKSGYVFLPREEGKGAAPENLSQTSSGAGGGGGGERGRCRTEKKENISSSGSTIKKRKKKCKGCPEIRDIKPKQWGKEKGNQEKKKGRRI